MRRIVLAAALVAAAALSTAPASAHHECADGQARVHVRDPRTGDEVVWACLPRPAIRPLLGKCPPGSSGTVVYPPVGEPIYFCEGP